MALSDTRMDVYTHSTLTHTLPCPQTTQPCPHNQHPHSPTGYIPTTQTHTPTDPHAPQSHLHVLSHHCLQPWHGHLGILQSCREPRLLRLSRPPRTKLPPVCCDTGTQVGGSLAWIPTPKGLGANGGGSWEAPMGAG